MFVSVYIAWHTRNSFQADRGRWFSGMCRLKNINSLKDPAWSQNVAQWAMDVLL